MTGAGGPGRDSGLGQGAGGGQQDGGKGEEKADRGRQRQVCGSYIFLVLDSEQWFLVIVGF